jgi:glycosyltransferase involved in cell wall biosynthesis
VRIAWVIRGDIAQPTGGYVYDRLVVEGLRALGSEVEVIGLEPEAPERAAAREDLAERLATRLIRPRSDVVVGDALCVGELGPIFDRLGGNTPRLLLVHHLTSWEIERTDRDALRSHEARAVRASDALVATSAATAARIDAEYPGRKVDVALPGSDRLPRLPRATRSGRATELLFIGSIVARKQLPLLLDAIEQLADLPLSLTLVGDEGREPAFARSIAARVAASPVLRAAVTACGVVADDVLARRMARADALVLPSSLEGYGMVLTEALRAGLPVVASRAAAHAAGLEGSGAALVFDDAPGLVVALRRMAKDVSLFQAMQQAAEAEILARWDETRDAFRSVLARLAPLIPSA